MTRRLSSFRLFVQPIALGVVALSAAAWLFGAIAEDVVHRDAPLGRVDLNVAAWLHAHATDGLTSVMFFVSDLGAPLTVAAIASITAIFLMWKRQYSQLLALVFAVPGGALLNVIVKQLVHRHRPVFDDPIQILTSYSFPSGHAMGSTALYGMLAALVVWQVRDARWRALVIVAASALIALIGFSRLYLGVHYLSDVLAGWLEGIVWLGACLVAMQALRHRNASRR